MPPLPAHLFPAFPLADLHHHRSAIHLAVQHVLEGGNYVLGDEVAAFESEFAAYLGVKHVVGVGSGTDAIELMLRALGIGAGSKVVVPTLSPSAVASGVLRSGAELLLADIDQVTFTLCSRSLAAVLSRSKAGDIKAVIAVHLYGHSADWNALQAVAADHGVMLLEDCAQAHGATYHGRMVGALGRAAAFSFYPTKNLSALGDAGAVATSDDELADRMRQLRQYGWKKRHISELPGINSRLDELQAAILRAKLTTLPAALKQRRQLAARYAARLPQPILVGCEHAFHQYVIRSSKRDALLKHLQEKGIPAAILYPLALHQQPAFHDSGSFPVAEQTVREILSLPMHPYLSEAAVDAVCDAVEEFEHAGA